MPTIFYLKNVFEDGDDCRVFLATEKGEGEGEGGKATTGESADARRGGEARERFVVECDCK